jgi:hypothetical protein
MVFLGEGVTVPKKVMVIPFDADLSIAIQATAQFAGALRSLGFEVVERPLEEMLGDSILTSETRIKLKEQIGIEGLFLGNIKFDRGEWTFDTSFNIRLIDVETGRVLWVAEVYDPRTFGSVSDKRTSATYTVNNAVKILKRDLKLK